MKYRNVLLFVYFFAINGLQAQSVSKKFIFDHYAIPQGFDKAQAICFVKDREGFVWIGTNDGLVRYDGQSFKYYYRNINSKNSLKSNYINKISIDKHNRLWISSLPNISVYDIDKDSFHHLSYSVNKTQSNFDVNKFYYEKENDVMYIASSEGLLYSQGRKIDLQKLSMDVRSGEEEITDIQITKDKKFWLASTFGLYEVDESQCNVKVHHVPGQNPNLNNDDGLFCSFLQNDSTLWLGQWVKGLLKFDIKNKVFSNHYLYRDNLEIQNGVIVIDSARSGNLWIGTIDGLYFFDIHEKKFQSYHNENTADPNAVSGSVFSFYNTPSEGMWIGTYKGLHRLDYFKQTISNHVFNDPSNYLAKNKIEQFVIEPNENNNDSIVWLLLYYNKIIKYDLINRKILPTPKVLNKYCDERVEPNLVFVDKKKRFWISSRKYGLVCYDLKSQKLFIPKCELPECTFFNVKDDTEGKVYFGSVNGICYYDEKTNTLHQLTEFNKQLTIHNFKNYAFTFTIDKFNNLWNIGFNNEDRGRRLIKYDLNKSAFEIINHKEIQELHVLESVLAASDGSVYVGSLENGFCIIKDNIALKNNSNLKFSTSVGIMEEDVNHDIWYSTDFGIAKYSIKNDYITRYNFYNSTIGGTIKPYILCSKNTGILYIAQNEGLDFIDVRHLSLPISNNPILSELKIKNYSNTKIPSNGETIKLKHYNNNVTLHYTNLSYTNSSENLYSFLLENNDKEWTTDYNGVLQFLNLSPGTYKLRVKSVNSFGIPSSGEFVLNIHISFPFWQTWWFYFIMALSSIGITYLIFRYREQQRLKLEHMRLRVARDLHDDIGSNLSMIRMLSESEVHKNENSPSFHKISEKTKEIMLSVSEIIWNINPKYDNLNEILIKIQEYAVDILEPGGIQIIVDFPSNIVDMDVAIDKRKNIFLIFKEAINNAAKYAKATQVTLSFAQQKNSILFAIIDNGIGFNPEFISKGNGLKNMTDRAASLGATISIETSVKGTKIVLEIPA